MFDFDEIVEKISEHAKISREEVLKQIEEKQTELSGLVSKEGAAYIVGRELGINLLKEGKKRLKIANIVSGMNFVELTARVVKISETKEFEKGGNKGRVANVFLGDDSGIIRLALWNEETKMIEEGVLKEDDVVRVTGGYIKTDSKGRMELRLGRGKIEKVEEEFTELSEIIKAHGRPEERKRAEIGSLKEGDYEEVRGCLVQVFRRNPFYESCPECRGRMQEENGKKFCREHGEVKPKHRLVISGILDDGTGNIRVVFFGETAERIVGKTAEELREEAEKKDDVIEIYNVIDCLGKELVVRGRVKRNQITENLEIIADTAEEADPQKEMEIALKEYKS